MPRKRSEPLAAVSQVYFALFDVLDVAECLGRRVTLHENRLLGFNYDLEQPTEVVRWLRDLCLSIEGWKKATTAAHKAVAAEQQHLPSDWRPQALQALQAHGD